MGRWKWLLAALLVGLAAATYVAWSITRVPDAGPYGLRLVQYDIDSELVGSELGQIAIVPEDEVGPRPLLVLLHGRGGSPEDMLSEELFAAIESEGERAPIVVLPDGGEASYFHDRAEGRWGSYVVEEVVPGATERFEVDEERLAIGGISMGGFGALDIARLHPDMWCAIGGHSPALFRSGADTTEGSFDDAEDFARHDLFSSLRESGNLYGDIPVWIDVGRDDPFYDAVSDFRELLEGAGAEVRFIGPAGGHNESYWWAHIDEYVGFYSDALEAC